MNANHRTLLGRVLAGGLLALVATVVLSSTGCPRGNGAVCGDGICQAGETAACSDCGGGPVCGNGVCEAGETAACSDCAAGGNAALFIQNSSFYDVWYVYISPCSSGNWGNDQLGASTIASGNSFTINNIPPGCYDFRAETQGATTFWEDYANTLGSGQTYTWTLTN